MITSGSFTPFGANTATPTAQVELAVTASAQTLTLPTLPQATQVRIAVVGTDPVSWAYGNAVAGLTVANGVPMLGNSVEVFGLPFGTTQLSFISSGTASTVRVVLGEGS
jgi:hypothetical protein